MKKYDVIVIGTGAGNIILEEALKEGLHCAQIERGKFGGTCLTRGCIPTKVLATVADQIRKIEESDRIGIKTTKPTVDWEVVSDRVWDKIDESQELNEFYHHEKNLDVYEGTGYFVSDKVIEVSYRNGTTSEQMTADKIFINVGGRTKVPVIKNLEEVGYLTSETFFGEKYPTKPYESLIIVGGGPIGVEFAHIFSAMGTKVTVVQHNVRLLPKEEKESSELVLKYLRKFGVEVHLNKETNEIRQEGRKKVLEIQDRATGEITTVSAEEIFIAPGIRSNSDLLKIENTSIEVDKRGWIVTNEFLETSVDGVWAVGDINGRQQFRHKANYEADIVAHNLFMGKQPNEFRWAEYSLVPYVTFCYPQVAHVGLTQEEAEKLGYEVSVGMNRYSQTAKGYALGFEPNSEYDGFAKLILDKKTNRILGLHVVGEDASVLIQSFITMMNSGTHTLQPMNAHIGSEVTQQLRREGLTRELATDQFMTLRETMVAHPTLSEVPAWTYYHVDEE